MKRALTLILMIASFAVMGSLTTACGENPTVVVTPPPPPTVTSVVVSPLSGGTIWVTGTSRPLVAVARKSDNTVDTVTTNSNVVWASSVTSVATVTTLGMVTAIAPGNSQISATFGGVTGTLNIQVQVPPVTVLSTEIVGDTTTEAPRKVQLRLVRKYSDGTEKDLVATWTYPNLDYLFGEVSPTGVVSTNGLGVVHVYASYEGVQYSHQVRIDGTPRSKLTSVSDASWVLVESASARNSLGNIVVWRLKDGVTKVWANSAIPRQNVVDGLDILVNTIKGGKFSYTFVGDSASSDVWLSFEGPTTPAPTVDHCGLAGGVIIDNTWSKGFIWLKPTCVDKITIAHEMTHIIGPRNHTLPNTDILSPPGVWSMSKDLADALNLIMSLQPGTILVDG